MSLFVTPLRVHGLARRGLVVCLLFLLWNRQSPGATVQESPSSWSVEECKHFLQRAGLGASSRLLKACQHLGRERSVDTLIELTLSPPTQFAYERVSEKERPALVDRYRSWWFEQMLEGRSPLTERMTLLWHGFFTSSLMAVREPELMIDQVALFREHGTGNFATLLHQVARNPAMLRYLNVGQSQKRHPNENFAREVMELFTLGPGQYTEQDIKEASRAFTGWIEIRGKFQFDRSRHDRGIKSFLGRRGPLDGNDILNILLAQPATAEHVASYLLGAFVIDPPPRAMVLRYARLLRRHQWELKPVLRSLFLDPKFTAKPIIGARILGPTEWLVSTARRLGEGPPGAFLDWASSSLGQVLLYPPSVQGWDEGPSWLTVSNLMKRRRIAADLVHGFKANSVYKWSPRSPRGGPVTLPQAWRRKDMIRTVFASNPPNNPEQLVDQLCERYLAIPVTSQTRESLIFFVKGKLSSQSEFSVPDEAFLKEIVLMILTLPEAQLG